MAQHHFNMGFGGFGGGGMPPIMVGENGRIGNGGFENVFGHHHRMPDLVNDNAALSGMMFESSAVNSLATGGYGGSAMNPLAFGGHPMGIAFGGNTPMGSAVNPFSIGGELITPGSGFATPVGSTTPMYHSGGHTPLHSTTPIIAANMYHGRGNLPPVQISETSHYLGERVIMGGSCTPIVAVPFTHTVTVGVPYPVEVPVEVPVPFQQVVEKLIPIYQQQQQEAIIVEKPVPYSVEVERIVEVEKEVDKSEIIELENQRNAFSEVVRKLKDDSFQIKAEIEALHKQKIQMETDISTLNGTKLSLHNQLTEIRTRITTSQSEVRSMEDRQKSFIMQENRENAELQAKLSNAESELRTNQTTIRQLRAKINEYTTEKGNLQAELDTIRTQYRALQTQVGLLEQDKTVSFNDLTGLRNENTTMRTRITEYEREINSLKMRLTDMMRAQLLAAQKASPGAAFLFRFFGGTSGSSLISTGIVEKFFKTWHLPFVGVGSEQMDFLTFAKLFEKFTAVNLGDREAATGVRMLWIWGSMDNIDVRQQLGWVEKLGLQFKWNQANRLTFDSFWAMIYALNPNQKMELYQACGLIGYNGRMSATETDYIANVVTKTAQKHAGLMMLFKFFDEGSRGSLPAADLKAFAARFGFNDIIDWSFCVGDNVSIVEFVCMFARLSLQAYGDEEVVRGLRMLWLWADDDGSGKLDSSERLRFMLRLGLKEISYVNKSGDHMMSFEDLWNMVYAIPGGKKGNLWVGGGILGRHGTLSQEEQDYLFRIHNAMSASVIAAGHSGTAASPGTASVMALQHRLAPRTSSSTVGGGSVISSQSSHSSRSISSSIIGGGTVTPSLKTLFTFFDHGNGGVINKSELYDFASRYAIANQLAWDDLHDRITLDQFCRVFGGLRVDNVQTNETMNGLRMLWNWVDQDGSGRLDSQERIQFMLRLGINQISWCDADRDGMMNFHEFWDMIQGMPVVHKNVIFNAAAILGTYGVLI